MVHRFLSGAALVVAISLSTHANAQDSTAQTAAPTARNDYNQADTWLCRPGRKDACAVDLNTTIVNANGKLEPEPFKAHSNPPIDCFYVYPTVSMDTTGNSDMKAGPEEQSVILQQFARFGAQCRTFAPLYRQVTLTALRSMIAGKPLTADRTLGYNDVLDAWNHYLKNDNNGRGVVLIGHSQGSGVLTQLIRNEIDGKPIQKQVISALLIGTNVAVPKGKDVGGAFQHMSLCRKADQTGCVVSYVSFRETVPPPANTRFGKVPGDNMVAACVNPAALGGGEGELHAYLSARGRSITQSMEQKPWTTPEQPIETPFVSVPGLLTGECIEDERGSYLSVKVNADPKDPRVDELSGDVVNNGQVLTDWGLHLIDMNVAMGNLLDVVEQQGAAWLKANK